MTSLASMKSRQSLGKQGTKALLLTFAQGQAQQHKERTEYEMKLQECAENMQSKMQELQQKCTLEVLAL